MSKSLSDEEIYKYFDNKINIVKFSDIKKMKSLKELLGPYKKCVILFEFKKDYGHWCSLIECKPKNNKKFILFTDPYGLIPENELNYVPKSFEHLSDQERGSLLNFLYNQPIPVHYSQFRLQQLKYSVNTCGRYAILRCSYPTIDENDFDKLLRATENTPDELVSILTCDV